MTSSPIFTVLVLTVGSALAGQSSLRGTQGAVRAGCYEEQVLHDGARIEVDGDVPDAFQGKRGTIKEHDVQGNWTVIFDENITYNGHSGTGWQIPPTSLRKLLFYGGPMYYAGPTIEECAGDVPKDFQAIWSQEDDGGPDSISMISTTATAEVAEDATNPIRDDYKNHPFGHRLDQIIRPKLGNSPGWTQLHQDQGPPQEENKVVKALIAASQEELPQLCSWCGSEKHLVDECTIEPEKKRAYFAIEY